VTGLIYPALGMAVLDALSHAAIGKEPDVPTLPDTSDLTDVLPGSTDDVTQMLTRTISSVAPIDPDHLTDAVCLDCLGVNYYFRPKGSTLKPPRSLPPSPLAERPSETNRSLPWTFPIGTGSSFLAFAILAARHGWETSERGSKSFFHLGGLTEGSETIALFVVVCLFPAAFPALAWVFGAACWVTTLGRAVSAWTFLRNGGDASLTL